MTDAPLEQTLARLRALCDAPRAALVDDLSRRVAAGTVRLLLVGEVKRGKSTLGNALLGREVLPAGVTPLTALATTVTAGHPERVEVGYLDGCRAQVPLAALGSLVTERENPSNVKGVASVEVVLDRVLVPGMSIVDTPGVGSVLVHNTDVAAAARDRMDLALVVLTADPPLSASEATLLAEVRERAVASFVVLNKADRLAPGELAEVLEFLRAALPDIDVIPCSARAGLDAALAGDGAAYASSGMAAVRAAVTERIATRGRADLAASVAAAARRLVDALRDEADVTLAAADAREAAGQERVAAFRGTVDRLPRAAAEASERITWWLWTVRRELTDDATERSSTLARAARAAVEDTLSPAGRTGSPTCRRDAADEILQELVREEVNDWSRAWGARLAVRLDEIAADERRHLEEAASVVRGSGERDLGVLLRVAPVAIAIDARPRFRLDLADPVGWEAPLAGTMRRHAPAALVRRRAVKDLRRRAADLPDKNVGRARHDLDQRLAEAAGALSAAVGAAYHDLGHGLGAALDAAASASALTAAQAAERRRELVARRRHLDALVEAFERANIPA